MKKCLLLKKIIELPKKKWKVQSEGWKKPKNVPKKLEIRKKPSRKKHLEEIKTERKTMVFYEAPHKLMRTLEDMKNAFGGDRKISLCRELTKIHEQVLRTDFDGAIEYFTETPPKGEFVLVIDGAPEEKSEWTMDDALELVEKYRAEGLSHKAACKKAAPETGFNPNELYNASLK